MTRRRDKPGGFSLRQSALTPGNAGKGFDMGVYDMLKDSVNLIEEFKDTPHYEKIVALRDQLIALSEEKTTLYK